MSGKQAKLNRKIVKKASAKIYNKGVNDLMKIMYDCNLWGRVKIAFSIIFKKL
jgi:hypothetical protein